MRKLILATVAALTLGGVTTGALIAHAQPAPPPAPAMDGPPPHHPQWMGWMRHGHEDRGEHARGLMGRGTFALVYRQEDRKLTAPDVQKIAEAFLLWNGNHTWKVVEVAPAADGAIGFGIATQEGSVIARFTMDAHTGRVNRVG
jgi:hypothetical protein